MKKPICYFDLEATSADVATARIVEFAALKIDPHGNKERLQFLINPGCPILNSDIHNITDEMVKDEPRFTARAEAINDFLHNCDLSGYNLRKFDVPLLAEEFARNGYSWSLKGRKIIDPFILYKILNSQSLSAAYKKYTGLEIDGAHRAMADVEASAEVLNQMIIQGHVPDNRDEIIKFQQGDEEFDSMVDFAGKFTRTKDGVIVFTFGKHRGEPVREHLDFVMWMIGKDFTSDTITWCRSFLDEPNDLPFH